jgi:hypothetical protein
LTVPRFFDLTFIYHLWPLLERTGEGEWEVGTSREEQKALVGVLGFDPVGNVKRLVERYRDRSACAL